MLDQKQELLNELRCLDDSRDLAAAFIETIHNQIATLSAEIAELERVKMQVFWQTESGQEYWKTCDERSRLSRLGDRMRVLQDLRTATLAEFEIRRTLND